MKYTASNFSKGNHISTKEIETQETGITVKTLSLHKGSSQFIEYSRIASVEYDLSSDGFYTIIFRGVGTNVKVHGFSLRDVEEIKEAVEKGREG